MTRTEYIPREVFEPLLDTLKGTDGVDILRETAHWLIEELIELDVSKEIGADRYHRGLVPSQMKLQTPHFQCMADSSFGSTLMVHFQSRTRGTVRRSEFHSVCPRVHDVSCWVPTQG